MHTTSFILSLAFTIVVLLSALNGGGQALAQSTDAETSVLNATTGVSSVGAEAVMAAGDMQVYQDAIASPWQDNSWNAAISYASTERIYAGAAAVKIAQNAWGGLSMHIGTWGAAVNVAPSMYPKFEFAIHGGSAGITIAVRLENDLAAFFPQVIYGAIPANQWSLVTLPMSQLNPSNQPIDRINILETSGAARTYYVDNIRFIGVSALLAPAAPTTMLPSSGATGVAVSPALQWNTSSGAMSYRAQLSTSATFTSTLADQSGLTTPLLAVSGLLNSTAYYWRVNASNTSGTSAWSTTANFTTAALLPSPPVLSAPANSATGVTLSPTLQWTGASGVGSYRVQVATNAAFTPALIDQGSLTSVSYSPSGLAYSTAYYWRVNAVNASGTSPWSATWAFTTGAAPVSSVDLVVYQESIQFPWQDNSWNAAVTYGSVERSYSGANAVKVVQNAWGGLSAHIGTWGAAVHVDPSLYSRFECAVYGGTAGATISLRLENDVAASFPQISYGTIPANQWILVALPMSQLNPNNQPIDRINILETSGAARTYFVDNILFKGSAQAPSSPLAPVLVAPSNGATNAAIPPVLQWNVSAGATSYRAQVSTASTFATTIADQSGLTAQTMTVSGVLNGTIYYWRVNAANASGTSTWSAVAHFTTAAAASAPAVPALSSPPNGATGISTTVSAQWTASGGATSYRLQASTSSTFATTIVDQIGITALSYSLAGLQNSATYYWRVNAANASGTSAWSAVANFTTVGATSAPAIPVLSSPANGATGVSTAVSVRWTASAGATSYRLQASTSSTFATTIVDQSGLTSLSYALAGLQNMTTYYWRVSASNLAASSGFSAARSFTTAAIIAPPPSGGMFVTAYFPDWSIWSMKPWQVDYSAMTHVIHFSADPDPATAPYFSPVTIAADSLKLQYGTGNGDRSINFQDSLIQYAHKSGVKVLLCIGGIYGTSDAKMDQVCNDINKIRVYVSAISNYCKRKGYDGVDIDWEFPNNRTDYANLITVLRDTLDRWPTRGIITAAVYMMPHDPYLGTNVALMNAKLDQMNLMNYDMGVSTYAGFNAPLKPGVCAFSGGTWTAWTLEDHSLDLWIAAGFTKSKLALGLPFYAWEFTGVDGPCQLRTGGANYRSYADVQTYLAQYPNSYRWDDSSKVPYLSFTDGSGVKHMVSYDDSTSLAYKIRWTKSKGVGGIMIYELLSGWLQSRPAGQRDPLLQAVKRAIAGQVFLPSVAEPTARSEGSTLAAPGAENGIPSAFGLDPNFPNPFNPTTSIAFQVPVTANVTIKIYDMIGREVATLVDGALDAGSHSISWDSRNSSGESVASGIYLYRMVAMPVDGSAAQAYTASRKLMLMK